jgi:uncharacterized protein YaaQ
MFRSEANAVLSLLKDMDFGRDTIATTGGEEGEAVFGGNTGVFCGVEQECWWSLFGDVAVI